jgi:hypothetical protein
MSKANIVMKISKSCLKVSFSTLTIFHRHHQYLHMALQTIHKGTGTDIH